MRSSEAFVGVDVSGATLDVAVRPSGKIWQVANSETGIRKLVAELKTLKPTLVVMLNAVVHDQTAWRTALLAA